MARPIVSAISIATPASSVSLDSSIAIRVTTQTARCASGTRRVMQSTSTATQPITMRSVPTARPGNGASSWRKKRISGMRSLSV